LDTIELIVVRFRVRLYRLGWRRLGNFGEDAAGRTLGNIAVVIRARHDDRPSTAAGSVVGRWGPSAHGVGRHEQPKSEGRMMNAKNLIFGFGSGLLAMALAGGASAQSEPFAGATIRIIVGTSPGSTYDTYARTMSEHMGRFISGNPQIIVQNQPGAGGAKAAAYIYNVAPKDGTVMGHLQQNLPLFQALTPEKVKYDTARMNWIGP
jgi:hypothetical protein